MMISQCENRDDSTLHGIDWSNGTATLLPLVPVHDSHGYLYQVCTACLLNSDELLAVGPDTTITRVVSEDVATGQEIESLYALPIGKLLHDFIPTAEGWSGGYTIVNYVANVRTSFNDQPMMRYRLTQAKGL